ncbi:MAG TPA: tetratricopeptide repeat protein, partial [Pyrinomonadaceae bacterium]|nr:tetratricopeptide repeat protein [Pyrinomonadaceae bacterium]
MKSDSLTQSQIRRYLLGQCDEAELEAIEAAVLTDDAAFEELLAAEDEVIDEYINKNLSPEERASFENRFLAGPERREQLRFARVFDRYLTSKRETAAPQPTPSRSSWAWMHSLYSSPIGVAVSAILLVVIALGVWQLFRQSDVEKGLLALNAAYREQRPLEARISNLDYAPFVVTRGAATQNVDQNELTRAELTLQEALKKDPSAAVHHALGKVYLAKKEFDRAIEQFDAGIKTDPNDASLYADLGAAWLEKGRLDLEAGASGKGTEQLGRSLENLNKALGLNPNLLEALFNRALCEEQLTLYSEAEKDWREYLTRDANSQWAQEARRRLQLLEEKKKKQAQKKD